MLRKLFLSAIFIFLPFLLADIAHSIYPSPEEVRADQGNTDPETKLEKVLNGPLVSVVMTGVWWGWDFLADNQKVTALATVLIAIYTVILASATKGLTSLAAQQERTSRTRERAYVYVRPGEDILEQDVVAGQKIIVSNYGQTPAFIKGVRWGTCPFKDWPKREMPPTLIVIQNVLSANTIDHKPNIGLSFPHGDETFAYYGRIYYRDVFGDSWYSTWELRVEPKDGWKSYPCENHAQIYPDDDEHRDRAS